MLFHSRRGAILLLLLVTFSAPQLIQSQESTSVDLQAWLKRTRDARARYAEGREKQIAKARTPQVGPTEADVRYGPYDRNVLDFYRADTANPAPVLVFFHGGGWVVGDKSQVNPRGYLNSGIAFVSANYRYTTGTPDAGPYPAPMDDGARMVQFIRSKAEEWNIDPDRVALTGGSAGAVISMWIAYRDDMAEPDSDDPVRRLSTRVTCIVPVSGPTTFDPELIQKRIGGSPEIHPALLPFFAVETIGDLKTETRRSLVQDASPLTHVTRGDPPTFMRYSHPPGGTPLPSNASFSRSIHHTEFGVLLKEELDALGVENVLQYKGDGNSHLAYLKFLVKHLKPESIRRN